MFKPRTSSAITMTCFTLALGFISPTAQYSARAQEEADNQLAAERKADQLNAIIAAFLYRISGDVQAMTRAGIDFDAICIAENVIDHKQGLVDARAEILNPLRQSITKIQPYSYCKNSVDSVNSGRRPIYWLKSFQQTSDQDAVAVIGFRDGMNGMYSDGIVYFMKKRNGTWEIDHVGAAWIT